jgi:hypothetical protein
MICICFEFLKNCIFSKLRKPNLKCDLRQEIERGFQEHVTHHIVKDLKLMTGNFLTTSRQLLPRDFLSPNSFKEQNYFKDEYFHDEILNCQESGSAM